MTLKDVDLAWLAKLTFQQIDLVTCLECCKYYIAPETAPCGHTLCHTCWRGRRTCPFCAKPFERRNLRHNLPIQNFTEHVQVLSDAFEKLFNIQLDEFLLDTGELECKNDPTKNVKEWLASSQNHFSVPAQSSGQSSQEIQQHSNTLNVTSNKIQIHTNTSKAKSPEKVIHVPIPQDDWDKIEHMPDTEDIKKDKENIVGPMDIEPFYIDDKEYTVSNPRRSSRKRELRHTKINNNMNVNKSLEKQSSRDSSAENDKKSNKIKQNWNNVKRMRKDFSKLNKINKSKLNVSIEMCKKTQSTANTNVLPKALSPQVYEIDENTPNDFNIEKQMMKGLSKEGNIDIEDSLKVNSHEDIENKKQICEKLQNISKIDKLNNTQTNKNVSQATNAETMHSSKHETFFINNIMEKTVKMPFYKRSALHPNSIDTMNTETKNYHINSNMAVANDDIEITIKVGNKITNIKITNKNDVELKVNTDREIQTSLGPHELNDKNHVLSPQKTKTRNVGNNHKIDEEHQSKTNPNIEELKKVTASVKSVSEKKNTDSADTATAQFEITESVEKELSKVMDCVEVDILPKSKRTPNVKEISEKKNSQKPANQHGLEYFNDLDIFEIESIKEPDVQLLQNTEHAPSEILLCTVKTKNKTQKHVDKRDRDSNDENALPNSKKPKLHKKNSMAASKTPEQNKSKQNHHESEPMTYDAIMGTVFTTIDADIEEIRQSQNINKNTHHTLNDNNNEHERNSSKETLKRINKLTQEVDIVRTNEIGSSKQPISEFCDQKYSENVFSVCVENEDDKMDKASTKEKMPINMATPNVNEFLTPVMCHNVESINEILVVDNDVDMVNDDSDKSLIEETPQKTTSFSKLKQKSNQANKEMNEAQNIGQTKQKLLTDKKSSESEQQNIKSVISLTDSSEIKSANEATVVEVVNKKSIETPLTINKFVDQIQYKSTPYARKSLNFHSNNVNDLDPEQTLCPTNDLIAKTTQEKEFMNKAFEKTPTTPTVRPLGTRNLGPRNKKFKIAGSCLTLGKIEKLKQLCTQHKWTYTDKYAKDLTHLVVGVDDENKSQRSVKYMCALASSIWIISYEWVAKCLETNDVVNEEYFEVLDSTGEQGPMRSRIATKKLFQGITFFCMEPFSVLDVDTLKGMLEAAGGRVVKEVEKVRVDDKTSGPAILLAEPENTQEDRFTYLAMNLSIVPVNFEWVLNCLGSYTLGSIQELLLCPASILPKAIEKWPQELVAQDED